MSLEKILGSKTRVTLLRQFYKGEDYTIAELSRALKMDKSLISRTISDLENTSLISIKRRGTLKICALNEKSPIHQNLKNLFEAEKNLK